MGIPSFLPLFATESDWAVDKPSQILSHMLLWTAVLALDLVAGAHADLPKAVLRLEPPWIQVFPDDTVTLACRGPHNSENHSTQWFHDGTPILTQLQPSYTFKAKNNDSGAYQCLMDQTSLSDPVQLSVIADWLLLQTPQLVFQEGDTIMLRCHGWRNTPLNRVTFYQNGISKRFSHFQSNFSIPQANQSHSGDYYCKGYLGRTLHSSKTVTIIVQAPKPSSSSFSPVLTAVIAATGIIVAVIVIILAALMCLKKKRSPALPGNPEHREMGEALPEEPANCTEPEEAAKSEDKNSITYSLLKHPENPEEETEPNYQNPNHI
uniref:low affinity immunoglobulin gamma Fc region receptor II-b isoform X4 n=1 Tax=Jaculus jaculus TaxID=51337 RepID=UPI001E1B5BE9|nr:low affinity immunoglobulin gamma Fc region receptor II-b isoform X4 [Jaculus jaculus]